MGKFDCVMDLSTMGPLQLLNNICVHNFAECKGTQEYLFNS
jgi:hypothetical protein